MLDILLLAGAISWITTALVLKDGPFGYIKKFKEWTIYRLRENSPLRCFHCTSFWVGLVVLSAWAASDTQTQLFIQFFGVLGIAQALRGMSGEWA